MQFIMNFVQSIFAIAAILPFVTFVILYFVLNYYMEDKKRAKTLTIDVTTALLIISVAAMFDVIFQPSMRGIWIILLILLVAFGLIGGAQSRNRGQVDLQKAFRTIWRISFLLLSVLYVIFLFVGIGQSFYQV